jgi:hypothetical protein
VLLVHSPLVGPSSWARTASVLTTRGYEVAVPDLTKVADAAAPRWRALVDTAAGAAERLSGPVALVGHSGAGAFLPAIGERIHERRPLLLFVDAVLPPRRGIYAAPTGMQELLDAQTRDGYLRRWLEWWPDDVVDELLPDPADRRALLHDMPRLPRAFYDEAVPVPDGWGDRGCAYVKLSEAYAAEFEEAASRGWTCLALDANHLSIRTEPERVADTFESIAGPA